jgi:hypothetical protein
MPDTAAAPRLERRLRTEQGFALVLALGVLSVMTIAGTSALTYTSANGRHASGSERRGLSFRAAEAGLNNALAVLSNPSVNALDPDALPSSEAAALTAQYEQGTARWWGTLDRETAVWTIHGVGLAPNPTGPLAAPPRRMLSARVPVTPVTNTDLAPNNQAWQYMFSTRTGTAGGCDQTLNNHVTGSSRFYASGNFCIGNNADFLGEALIVKGDLYLGNGSDVGSAESLATRVEVAVGGPSGCRYHNAAWHLPCSDADHVFSKMGAPNWVVGVNHAPATIAAPTIDWSWYEHAVPGPTQPCTHTEGSPPVFDVDSIRNNNAPTFELTPPTTSYKCRVGPEELPSGEISWDHVQRKLRVIGVVYLDGSATVTGSTTQYEGRGSLYLSGTFKLDGKLCGAVSLLNCDFGGWNPNEELLTVVTGATGGVAGTGNGVQITANSHWQGALYASGAVYLGNDAHADGPIVASHIVLSNHVDADPFPFITTVPPGLPGNPNVYAQPNEPELFSG